MSQIHGLLRMAQNTTLISRRAPAVWQREMARCVARLDSLPRASAWVETLVAINPRLREEPLLGRCLAALTDQLAQSIESNREISQSRQSRGPRSEPLQKYDQQGTPVRSQSALFPQSVSLRDLEKPVVPRVRPTLSQAEPAMRRPAPFQLEPQVNRSLLQHLASKPDSTKDISRSLRRPQFSQLTGSEYVTGHGQQIDRPPDQLAAPLSSRKLPSRRPADIPTAAKSLGRTRHLSVQKHLASKTRAAPLVSQDLVQQKDWLHDLAQRAWCSLRQNGLDVVHTPLRVSSDLPEFRKTPPLVDQWATLLNGWPASVDLLVRLAGAPTTGNNRSGRKAKTEAVSQRTPGSPSLALSSLLAQRENEACQSDGSLAASDLLSHLVDPSVADHNSFARNAKPRLARSHPLTRESSGQPARWTTEETQPWQAIKREATKDAPAIVSLPDANQTEIRDNEAEPPARIAAPIATPVLPPLLQSQGVNLLPTLSVAAALSRHGARQEGTAAAEDDLGALTAKIKRILDEEARRHGIDV